MAATYLGQQNATGTKGGPQGTGSAAGIVLGATTAQVIWGGSQTGTDGGRHCDSGRGAAVACRVAGTAAFDLNFEIDPNNDGSWYVVKQVASTTVTVDGDTASYTQAAQLVEYLGFKCRVSIYTTAGGTYVWDVREFQE